jgi:Alternative complex III, ActD subunit
MSDDRKEKHEDGSRRDESRVSRSSNLPVAPTERHPRGSSPRHLGQPALYGVMAEFANPSDLVAAARAAYEAGYRRINGYSPFPIEELWEAIGFHRTALPIIVFIGGLLGATGGFLMQYYLAVIDYPLNVGGKPLDSWPAFIPITFECTILVAALSAVFGMLALNKLPQPYHPVFNAPNFALATRDSFFLVIEASDRKYQHDEVVSLLKRLGPVDITDVEV